jgi:hypothetical protein
MSGVVRCGFCGKSPEEVRTILTSGASAICDECVFTALDTIGRQPGPGRLYLRVAYGVFTVIASIGRLLTFGPRASRPPRAS